MNTHYDIAICGAGLVGICLALALVKQTPYKVLLFDAKPLAATASKQYLDTRTLALNHFSQQLFTRLGLWSALEAVAEPIRTIQISERGSFAKAFLRASELEVDALGYVVEIADLQTMLYQQLQQAGERLYVLDATRLQQFDQQADQVRLELQGTGGAQSVTCQWLIAADSSQSFIRQQLAIPVTHRDYRQSAIVCTVELAQSSGEQAFERFLTDGVLALLPLSQHRCGAVWVMASDQIEAHLNLSDEAYRQALQQQFGRQLGNFVNIGPRQHYPLQLLLAERVIDRRTIIIGNAAHTINPIGAQGLNLGLHDVAGLLRFFKQELNEAELEQLLLERNRRVAQFSDISARLYALDFCPINLGRRLGLLTLEHMGWLKKHFSQRMMGY